MAAKINYLLVVDDDSNRRIELAGQLEGHGYAVAVAENGQQALEMLGLQVYDLVLLNTDMPKMSGIEVYERMKADNGLQHIPVVMMADTTQLSEIERVVQMGVNDYFFRPSSAILLKARIESQLRKLPDYEDDYLKNVMENTKYERDLQIGRQIQGDFLPESLPEPKGWDIAAHFDPAREVAGDFYDSFMLSQNRRVAIVLADVCDKGVGAALFMALIRSLIRTYVEMHVSLRWMDFLDDNLFPSQGARQPEGGRGNRPTIPSTGTSSLQNAVVLTNNYLIHTHSKSNMFATAFFGVLDQASGTFTYVNGGHCPAVFFNSQGIKERLRPTGPAVGIMPDVEYKVGHIQFEPGDTLFIYSDGVTDARNPSGQMFTEKRMLSLIEDTQTHPFASSQELLDRISATLQEFISTADQFDDITMMAVRREPSN
jgi:serine phosphatase RsbU (regulator of sigma subunit)